MTCGYYSPPPPIVCDCAGYFSFDACLLTLLVHFFFFLLPTQLCVLLGTGLFGLYYGIYCPLAYGLTQAMTYTTRRLESEGSLRKVWRIYVLILPLFQCRSLESDSIPYPIASGDIFFSRVSGLT